jgi:hypothetical protein
LRGAGLSGQNLGVPIHRTDRHAGPRRVEPREIAELRLLKAAQPELAAAADMQIELIQAQRRVQVRVPLPAAAFSPGGLTWPRPDGRPLLQFDDLPIDWTDFRLMLRQTADILRRFETLDSADYKRIQALAHEAPDIRPPVARWYNAAAGTPPAPDEEMLDQVLLLAMRPFLARCAEGLLPGMDLSDWHRPDCPLCGGEPEFAWINASAERLLICGRCTGTWRHDPLACPFCGNGDPARITSFASHDGRYRIYGCEGCRRYLKAYDGRRGDRPVMLAVDSIATLPLDAAAMQRGYRS